MIVKNMQMKVKNSKRVYLLNLPPIINLYVSSTWKILFPNYLEVSPYFCEYPSMKKKEGSYAYDLGVGRTLRF